MKGTFNSYVKQPDTKVGGNTPVWCGTVAPIATGGVIDDLNGVVAPGAMIPAGTPCEYSSLNNAITLVGPSSEASCNGYIYNDVYPAQNGKCTAAVVMAHGEGLLIDRVPGIDKFDIAALQAACPTVILIRETQED